MALLLPVDSKRIEVFVFEIHHREEFVHQTIAHPALCILTDLGIGIPAVAAISGQVVKLAYRRAAQLNPWFLALHGIMNLLHDMGDVSSSLLAAHLEVPGLRVSDVVEVDAVDIVFVCNLAADLG